MIAHVFLCVLCELRESPRLHFVRGWPRYAANPLWRSWRTSDQSKRVGSAYDRLWTRPTILRKVLPRPCAVVPCVGGYARARFCMFDATALCRGRSRCLLISPSATSVKVSEDPRPGHIDA